jgi:hypothetical protein
MLTNCSNPSCSAPFRKLQDGKLFCLERDRVFRHRHHNRAEYFWLCHHCSTSMTLRLEKAGTVVPVLLPEPFRGAPDGIDFSLVDRKKGLLLRSVRFTCEATSGKTRSNPTTTEADNTPQKWKTISIRSYTRRLRAAARYQSQNRIL